SGPSGFGTPIARRFSQRLNTIKDAKVRPESSFWSLNPTSPELATTQRESRCNVQPTLPQRVCLTLQHDNRDTTRCLLRPNSYPLNTPPRNEMKPSRLIFVQAHKPS